MAIFKFIKINSTTAREFIFFLLLTTLVAALIKLSKTYTTTYNLETTVSNLPLEKSIRKRSTETISLEARHTGFALLRNSVSSPVIHIPYDELQENSDGSYSYLLKNHIDDIQKSLHGKIDINTIQPSTIIIEVDSMASKKVRINPVVDLSYAPGYGQSSSLTVEPDSVLVVGPTALLSKIKKVDTKKLSMVDVSSSIDEEIALQKKDSTEQLKYSLSEVSLFQEVSRFTEGKVTVPIQVINKIGGEVKILPKTVEIIFSVRLGDFEDISSSDFQVTSVYDNTSRTDNYLPLSITRMPDQITSARLVDKQVQFIVIK